MAVLSVVLLVLFIIVVVLLILLVLVQNEEGDSLGGVFAGGSSSVFGSRSGNILTRATSVLGALFLALSFGMALLNRTPGDKGVEAAGRRIDTEQSAEWWLDETTLDNNDAPALEASPSVEDRPVLGEE
jgi:preprotein translocase subunit SecG